jgi:hypothetical protein
MVSEAVLRADQGPAIGEPAGKGGVAGREMWASWATKEYMRKDAAHPGVVHDRLGHNRRDLELLLARHRGDECERVSL